MGGGQKTLEVDESDLELLYVNACSVVSEGHQVIVQESGKVPAFSELFYTQVMVNDKVELKGMLDSGSMTCTMSEAGEPDSTARIMLVGCGGKQTHPKCMYDLTLTVYGVKCIVPVLVVSGQHDGLIIGSNVIKCLMHVMKNNDDYWKFVSTGEETPTF